jgi:hypothetical protein
MTHSPEIEHLTRELGDFILLMEQETAVLGTGQADALAPLTIRRETANQRIAGAWRDLALAVGLDAGVHFSAMREYFSRRAPHEWSLVEELARQAEQMNRLNSRLIDEQLRRTQAAVQVLRGAANSRMLYGSDGLMSEFLNPNRNIDTA